MSEASAAAVAVLGFRPHTYWTAVVALAGEAPAPRVIDRRRIVFAEGDERFAYHQAAETDLAGAATLIDAVRVATVANAAREIGGLVTDLKRSGVTVRLAATPAGTAKLPEKLEDILHAHSRIHAAEGTFYRDVVAAGCAGAGLEVRRVVERELPALVCDLIDIKPAELEARLNAMGVALGPPWSEDFKLATQAAWICLES